MNRGHNDNFPQILLFISFFYSQTFKSEH